MRSQEAHEKLEAHMTLYPNDGTSASSIGFHDPNSPNQRLTQALSEDPWGKRVQKEDKDLSEEWMAITEQRLALGYDSAMTPESVGCDLAISKFANSDEAHDYLTEENASMAPRQRRANMFLPDG